MKQSEELKYVESSASVFLSFVSQTAIEGAIEKQRRCPEYTFFSIYIIVHQVWKNIMNAFQARQFLHYSRNPMSFFLESEEDVITLGVAKPCLSVVCPLPVITNTKWETIKSLIPLLCSVKTFKVLT